MQNTQDVRGGKASRPGWKLMAAGAAAVAVAASGTTYAVAEGLSSGDEMRDQALKQPESLTGNTGTLCRIGFDTQAWTNIPPDDSTSNNTPAGSVTVKKTCHGVVIGRFTSEITTPATGDFIHIDMRATCVGSGGLTNACTPGQEAYASPGHSFFQSGQAPLHVGAVNMVWSGLKVGLWRFEVLPGGNNSANLQFRSFTVEMFQPVGAG